MDIEGRGLKPGPSFFSRMLERPAFFVLESLSTLWASYLVCSFPANRYTLPARIV